MTSLPHSSPSGGRARPKLVRRSPSPPAAGLDTPLVREVLARGRRMAYQIIVLVPDEAYRRVLDRPGLELGLVMPPAGAHHWIGPG